MTEGPDRTAQFLTDMAALRVKASGRNALLLRAGGAGLGGGLVLALVAFVLSRGAATAQDQADYLVLAIVGLTAAVVGAALFLRYSFGEFLRFWLARVVYQQAHDVAAVPEAAPATGGAVLAAAEPAAPGRALPVPPSRVSSPAVSS